MLKHVTLKPGLVVVQGQFKMAPFDRLYTSSYCCVFFLSNIYDFLLEVNEFKKGLKLSLLSLLKIFFFTSSFISV